MRWVVLALWMVVGCQAPPGAASEARFGQADLEDWDPTRGPAQVSGDWAFVWGQLIGPDEPMPPEETFWMPVPGRWTAPEGSPADGSAGVGTYRVQLVLPEDAPHVLALELGRIAGASRIWIDDRPLPPSGVVSTDLDEVVEDVRRRSASFVPEGQQVDITVQVANLRHQASGIRRELVLGTPEQLETLAARRTMADTAAAAALLTTALVFLTYAIVRRRDRHYAWFAGLCLLFGLRGLLVGPAELALVLPTSVLPFLVRLRLEYASLLLGAWLGLCFIQSVARDAPRHRGLRTLGWLSLVFFGLAMVVPITWLSQALPAVLVFSVGSLAAALVWLTPWAWRGDTLARPVALAAYVFAAAALHDVALTMDWIRSPMLLSSSALLAGLLSMGLVLVRDQSQSLTLVERLSRDLKRAHDSSLRFVPRAFLERLGRSSLTEVKRGDSTQLDMAVMFTDLRSFTTLTESWGAERAFSFINRYLLRTEPAITSHEGFINQYLGDGVMALFPTCAGAVDSARQMCSLLAAFNASDPDGPVRIGIGISAGPLMLGTLGGEQRMDGGVIGDTVNQASRVEGMTKLYGAVVLIDEHVCSRLSVTQRGELRELDLVIAKGKTSPTRIYELLDVLPPDERDQKLTTRSTFTSALAAYRQGDMHQALEGFLHCEREAPLDATATLYVERCERWLEHALPADWEGITSLRHK